MKTFLLLFLFFGPTAYASDYEQPPFEVKDPGVTENFRNIYYGVDGLSLQVSSMVTANYLTASSATVNFLTLSSATATYLQLSSSTIYFIQSSSALQTGQFNLTSGTVRNFRSIDTISTGTYTINGGTIAWSGGIESGTMTVISTRTFQGAVFNGRATDNSTTTLTGTNIFTGSTSIRGSISGTGAAQGDMGEVIVSSVGAGSPVSSSGTSQWFDVTSITLTAGIWLVYGYVGTDLNGATAVTFIDAGVSSTSGNSSVGLTFGATASEGPPPTSTYGTLQVVPVLFVRLSGSATYYLKAKMPFSTGTPRAYGLILGLRIY